MPRGDDGVSLLELTIAMALTLALTASVFAIVRDGWRAFSTEPQTADMQQRLRVAVGGIARDLVMAGAGPSAGGQSAPLVYTFPPVLPFRQGAVADDPPGTFRTDTVTVIYVPATIAQTTLRVDLAPGAQTLDVVPQANCPSAAALCGFASGMTILVYEQTGNFDTFTVAAVEGASSQIAIAPRPQDALTTTYKAGANVVEAQLHTYYVKIDPVTQIAQLMHYDGSANAGVPVVDHLVGLRFDYYGEPRPPALTPSGATYGPAPPLIGVSLPGYSAGENCVFAADADTGLQFPRLPVLGAGDALTTLTAAQLTDGPWCPDAVNANRWDADLLRIRTVVVTARVESALASLRGPAGALFANPGTSTGGSMWAPDIEISLQVTPRNMSVSR